MCAAAPLRPPWLYTPGHTVRMGWSGKLKLVHNKQRTALSGLRRVAAYAWAAPCTLVGLCLATLAYPAGGRIRLLAGVLEAALWPDGPPGRLARMLPFTAITFGHVVIALTWREQDRLRAHEREHVRQYECWGVAFLIAYPLSSLWQMVRGRHYYWDNWFEVQAREAERFGWPPQRP